MRMLITGGTGLVGSALAKKLAAMGHNVRILTRNAKKAREKLGSGFEFVSELDSLDGVDAVVNLAGEPLWGKRWTPRQKHVLRTSRVGITGKISALINSADNPPKVFISGSAVGYYGAQGDGIIGESSPWNGGFLHDLCAEWEDAAFAAKEKTRVCAIRTGVVLSGNGGMLSALTPLFRLGLGAAIGNGKQYVSWLHISDMVGAVIFLLNNDSAGGVYNMCAPNPVTNTEFSKELALALHRPCLFRIPALVPKLLFGGAAELATEGQRAVPEKLREAGYEFKFPDIKGALADIFGS